MNRRKYNQEMHLIRAKIDNLVSSFEELKNLSDIESEAYKVKLALIIEDLLLLKQGFIELEKLPPLNPATIIQKEQWLDSATKLIIRIIIEWFLNS